jgi:hypothetical protein
MTEHDHHGHSNKPFSCSKENTLVKFLSAYEVSRTLLLRIGCRMKIFGQVLLEDLVTYLELLVADYSFQV